MGSACVGNAYADWMHEPCTQIAMKFIFFRFCGVWTAGRYANSLYLFFLPKVILKKKNHCVKNVLIESKLKKKKTLESGSIKVILGNFREGYLILYLSLTLRYSVLCDLNKGNIGFPYPRSSKQEANVLLLEA